MKGPVVIGTILGALFDNWVVVKLYHNNRQGRYEHWTLLYSVKQLPVSRILMDEAVNTIALATLPGRPRGTESPALLN